MRLPSRRAEFALQAGDHARRDRRADAERKADRDHRVARRQIRGRAQRRRASGRRGWSSPAAPRGRARAAAPMIVASDSVPSAKISVDRGRRRSTTCRLVRMTPLSTITTPVPTPRLDVLADRSADQAPARAPLTAGSPRRPARRPTAEAPSRARAAPPRRCRPACTGAAWVPFSPVRTTAARPAGRRSRWKAPVRGAGRMYARWRGARRRPRRPRSMGSPAHRRSATGWNGCRAKVFS